MVVRRVARRSAGPGCGAGARDGGWGGGDAAYPGVMDSTWTAIVWSLAPTIVVSVLFFFVLRSILRLDRTERRVHAEIEAEERAKRGLPPVGSAER